MVRFVPWCTGILGFARISWALGFARTSSLVPLLQICILSLSFANAQIEWQKQRSPKNLFFFKNSMSLIRVEETSSCDDDTQSHSFMFTTQSTQFQSQKGLWSSRCSSSADLAFSEFVGCGQCTLEGCCQFVIPFLRTRCHLMEWAPPKLDWNAPYLEHTLLFMDKHELGKELLTENWN
jgi:hypothetical protein